MSQSHTINRQSSADEGSAQIIDFRQELLAPRPPRLRIFNVKYSPNLGDGLLSECLEAALIECGASAETWSVDLAARSRFGEGSGGRSLQMRVLESMPPPLRAQAVRLPLAIQSRRRWRPHYRSSLEGADAVVIGGGNLLADLDLNFPTKIALAVDEAARRGLPVFIYGCGVSSGWSRRGQALLERAMRKGAIRRVFVRDERSQELWDELAGRQHGCMARVVRDPGLLASTRYGIDPDRPCADTARPIGINITSQIALGYHSDHAPSVQELEAWYLDLARTLVAAGHCIEVFTNGSPEDRLFAERLRPDLLALRDADKICFPEVTTPEELTRLIAGQSGLVAFRMHAIIAAYSCGVPFIALAWDSKLESFVASVDRMDWLCRTVELPGQEVASRLLTAIGSGIPAVERNLVIAQARRGVAMLHDEIVQALATTS